MDYQVEIARNISRPFNTILIFRVVSGLYKYIYNDSWNYLNIFHKIFRNFIVAVTRYDHRNYTANIWNSSEDVCRSLKERIIIGRSDQWVGDRLRTLLYSACTSLAVHARLILLNEFDTLLRCYCRYCFQKLNVLIIVNLNCRNKSKGTLGLHLEFILK